MNVDSTQTPLFFRCDAGREDGLGHLSRCLNLADAIFRDRGVRPKFITYAPDGIGSGIITARGFEAVASPGHAGTADDLAFVLDALQGTESDAGVQPLLVIDSKRIDAGYAADCGRAAVLVCLDDESLRDLPCDMIVNSNIWISADGYPPRPGRTVLAGAAYNLIRPELFACRTPRLAADPPLQILITLGGEDPHDHTTWILDHLGDLFAEHEVTVILGPAHPSPERARRAAQARLPRAKVVDAPPSLTPYIAKADLALTAGGTTCYELAAARVPQAAIVVEDHQWALVRTLQERDCLVILGSHDGLDPGRARGIIQSLLGSETARAKLAEAAEATFPDSGVDRVAQAILTHSQQAK